MFRYEDLEAMENDEIDIFAKPKNCLKLRKCWFLSSLRCTDIDSTGNLLYKQGYVVIGFLGSTTRKFIIPNVYNNLPIIGISHDAYDSIDEVVSAKKKLLKNYLIKVEVCFYSENILFVFPPNQDIEMKKLTSYSLDLYPDTPRYIEVTYYSNYSKTSQSKKTGDCSLYEGHLMYPYANNGNLLEKIISVKKCPQDFGYTSKGVFQYSYEYLYQFSSNKVVQFNICLSQSNFETFKDSTTYPRKFYTTAASASNDDPVTIETASFQALNVSKYFGKKFGKAGTFKEISSYFSKNSSRLGFVKKVYNRKSYFAFNTIKGTDIIIDCDSQFHYHQ